jgi:hypothetical protein
VSVAWILLAGSRSRKAANTDWDCVLEGGYTFTSGATSASATLTFGGGIAPAATTGVTRLTLNGANNGANGRPSHRES